MQADKLRLLWWSSKKCSFTYQGHRHIFQKADEKKKKGHQYEGEFKVCIDKNI